MYPEPSRRFLAAHRASNTRLSRAWHHNLATGQTDRLTISDGVVTVDVDADSRRSLSLTLPNQPHVWDLLDTVGSRITIQSGVRYTDRREELVPLGTFVLNDDAIDDSVDGAITMTCPDLSYKHSANDFGVNRSSVAANTVPQELKRLVEGAFNAAAPFPGWSPAFHPNLLTGYPKVGFLVYSEGRAGAIKSHCETNGLEVFYDADGLAAMRKIPTITSDALPVWTIAAGDNGVLRNVERERRRSDIRNALRITSSASDVAFAPVWLRHTVAGDPYSTDGQLGEVVEQWESSKFRSSTQARAAGWPRLAKLLSVGQSMSLGAASNPLLDGYDIFAAVLPKVDRNMRRPVGLQMIESVTHPLVQSGNQDITTRHPRDELRDEAA